MRKLAVLSALALLLSQLPKAKSQSLYDLGTAWWNEGGITNSKKFADGIVAAFEGIPGNVAKKASELAASIQPDNPTGVPAAETGYTATMSTLSVEPTTLPPALPVVSGVTNVRVGETYMFVPKDGSDTELVTIMDHTTSGQWQSIPEISPSKWTDYTVYGPLPPETDEEYGGKRRKRRQKTLRRKK
jgi:hypothetical protein